jgi:hypothetical protein
VDLPGILHETDGHLSNICRRRRSGWRRRQIIGPIQGSEKDAWTGRRLCRGKILSEQLQRSARAVPGALVSFRIKQLDGNPYLNENGNVHTVTHIL